MLYAPNLLRPAATALAVLLFVFMLGCSTEGTAPPPAGPATSPDGVKVGQTTRAEVYAMFGPGYVEEDGRDVIYYSPEALAAPDEDGLPCYRCPAEGFGVRIAFRDSVVIRYQLIRP